MELDFVLQSDIIKDFFNLSLELGKRAVICWSEPFVFGFSPISFRQI